MALYAHMKAYIPLFMNTLPKKELYIAFEKRYTARTPH